MPLKKNIILLLFIIPFIQSFRCSKDFYDPRDPNHATVLLSATINDSSETIRLGDTLQFTLVVPDTVELISKINGNVSKTYVSSLQAYSWIFYYYYVDTTKINSVKRLTDKGSAYAAEGSISNFQISINKFTKPYTATLHIVPATKGFYYIEFGLQETRFRINNSIDAGLRLNVNAPDKHWKLLEPYLPGISSAMPQRDKEGYGWYCFNVK